MNQPNPNQVLSGSSVLPETESLVKPVLILQAQVLERIARGAPLEQSLSELAHLVQANGRGVRCCTCVLDAGRQYVRHVISYDLSKAVLDHLINAPAAEPYAAPCIQAAVEGRAVGLVDAGVPQAAGQELRYCHSLPIHGSGGESIGSFTTFFADAASATPELATFAAAAVRLAAIAIQKEMAENVQRETNHWLETALEGAEVGAWDHLTASGQVTWSPWCRKIFSLPPEGEVTFAEFMERVHPDDLQTLANVVGKAAETGEICHLEYRVELVDGSGYRWVSAIGRGVYNSEGELQRMRGIAMDISPRKEAEAKLQESEAHARARAEEVEALMNTTPIPICISQDAECTVIQLNRAARELFGIQEQENTNVEVDEKWMSHAPVEIYKNGKSVPREERLMARVGRSGRTMEDNVEARFHDGRIMYLYGRAEPLFHHDGTVRGVIGAYVDVTGRQVKEDILRTAQNKLQLALDATGLGLWELELPGGGVEMTERCRELLGLDAGVTHVPLEQGLKAVHPDDLEHIKESLAACLDPQGEGTMNCEYRVLMPDGQERWLRAFGKATFTEVDGEKVVNRMVGTILNVTERKQAERAAEDAAERFQFLAESLPAKIFTADVEGDHLHE